MTGDMSDMTKSAELKETVARNAFTLVVHAMRQAVRHALWHAD